MPADQAQYIHRVGRTARAGKQGQAILLLHDFERFFLQSIRELPVEMLQPTPAQVSPPACLAALESHDTANAGGKTSSVVQSCLPCCIRLTCYSKRRVQISSAVQFCL